jgi:hypothetical protein
MSPMSSLIRRLGLVINNLLPASYFAAMPNYSAKLPNNSKLMRSPAVLGKVVRVGAKSGNTDRRADSVAVSGRAGDLLGRGFRFARAARPYLRPARHTRAIDCQVFFRKRKSAAVLVFRFGVLPRFRIRRGERIINFDQLLFAGVSCFGKNRRSAEGLGGSGIVSGPDERLAFRYPLAPCLRRVVAAALHNVSSAMQITDLTFVSPLACEPNRAASGKPQCRSDPAG